MKTLELKHLAPYLPYGLKLELPDFRIVKMLGLREDNLVNISDDLIGHTTHETDRVKPILHPLSDLTKEIEVNGEMFYPTRKLGREGSYSRAELKSWLEGSSNYQFQSYWIIEKLFEWHFDVFGLIKDGLAIDINTKPN